MNASDNVSNKMKMIVTGASGFVGREVVSCFQTLNYEVLKVSSPRTEEKDCYKIDISKLEEVKSLEKIGKVDFLIHCAGLAHQFGRTNRKDFFDVNVTGTEHICNLAVKLKVRHVILISSVSVYGRAEQTQKGIDEDYTCKPVGFYAESKLESEKIAEKICGVNNIKLTILRPSTIIGEEDPGNVAKLIQTIDNKKFIWIGKGRNLKSLIYKTDVARACVSVIKKETHKIEIFNVTAEPLTMFEIVGLIAGRLEKKVPKIYIPERLIIKSLQIGLNIIKSRRLSNLLNTLEKWVADDFYISEKIKENYNFVPEVSAKEAITKEVDHIKIEI